MLRHGKYPEKQPYRWVRDISICLTLLFFAFMIVGAFQYADSDDLFFMSLWLLTITLSISFSFVGPSRRKQPLNMVHYLVLGIALLGFVTPLIHVLDSDSSTYTTDDCVDIAVEDYILLSGFFGIVFFSLVAHFLLSDGLNIQRKKIKIEDTTKEVILQSLFLFGMVFFASCGLFVLLFLLFFYSLYRLDIKLDDMKLSGRWFPIIIIVLSMPLIFGSIFTLIINNTMDFCDIFNNDWFLFIFLFAIIAYCNVQYYSQYIGLDIFLKLITYFSFYLAFGIISAFGT